MKYWINRSPGDDRLIVWDGNKIYKANPKEPQLREMEFTLRKGVVPEGIFAIFKSQIRAIEMDKRKKHLCVYYNAKSDVYFSVSDDKVKNEIFEEIAQAHNAITFVKELSVSEKTQAQSRAFAVLSILFFIGLIFSMMMETGDLPDGKYPAVLVFLAGMGTVNLFIFYLVVISIIGIKFYIVSRTPKIIHTIKFGR